MLKEVRAIKKREKMKNRINLLIIRIINNQNSSTNKNFQL